MVRELKTKLRMKIGSRNINLKSLCNGEIKFFSGKKDRGVQRVQKRI